MPTVVGTCGDCIVSLPAQPKTSLVLTVGVLEGMNLVRKRIANFDNNYPADNITETQLELAPGGSYTTPHVTVVCVKSSIPVQVTVALAGNLFTFNVNKVLVLDDTYDSVEVKNVQATGGTTAEVFLAYGYLTPTP